MTSWDACSLEPNSVLRWIECHPSFAGYLQAVGTIAAFAVALIAPPAMNWLAERRRRVAQLVRSRRVAVTLVSDLVTLGTECRSRLDKLSGATSDTEEDRRKLLEVMSIALPGKIDLVDVESQGLDPIVMSPIIGAAARVRAYNGKLRIFSEARYSKDEFWQTASGTLKEELRLLNAYLEDAIQRILKPYTSKPQTSAK